MDLAGESRETMDGYGAEPGKVSFANNCLLARRLVERGTRFVQLYHTDWDHHGNKDTNLGQPLDDRCREVDQAAAMLVKDLKQRGLLDQTLVVWGGEFGRTPMGEPRELIGRDHHIDGYTMWMAGGGIKAGQTIGTTTNWASMPSRTASMSRLAGDDPAPARPGPSQADVPLPGPQLPADGCCWRGSAKLLA